MNGAPVVVALFIACVFFLVVSCDSNSGKSPQGILVSNLDVVKIGRPICVGSLPLAIIEKKFADEIKRFRLKTVQNKDWKQVVADMVSGKLDGAFILSPLAMNLIREGFPGKIVLMANRNGVGFVLSKKYKSISDLKNFKTIIAVPHTYSQHHVLLHSVLQQYGVPAENVRVLNMPPGNMTNSLRNNEIDGFVVSEPEGSKAISLGVGWMALISPDMWKGHMEHVFLATNTFINGQPERLQELINNLVRAGEFIEKFPDEAAVIGEDYAGSVATVIDKTLTTPPDWISYKNMVVNEADIITMAEKLVDMKLWPEIPEDIINDYFDMRYVTRAEQTERIR